MQIIAKKTKKIFILELGLTIILSVIGVIILNVTKDLNAVALSVIFFTVSAILLLLSISELASISKGNIIFNEQNNSLLISTVLDRCIPKGTPKNNESNYYTIQIKDIIYVHGDNQHEGGGFIGRLLFGIFAIKSINELIISYMINEEKITCTINNLDNAQRAADRLTFILSRQWKPGFR